ncbi:hypothetical protein CTA2_7199 [Colletotrichum tanaceti]|uniref:Uncharacterized protein n=1 Tax=Colletotrichum tanaceti TaxID=1306861 RepID=A0A4U6XBJ9_9PEZI|nr:hypothetical protein CTA2_7199 [Colletotrichum tanaceti]TKW53081.1 hypothetical protein CTA1_4683 [Colletotrichum tanaceti]
MKGGEKILIKTTDKHLPRSHRGYYREDDDVSVHEGAIERNKDWSTYRKTDAFILFCAAGVILTILGGGIAIAAHFASGGSATGSAGQASDAHIVARFPVMQLNAVHPTGIHFTANHTHSSISFTSTSILCADDAEPTETETKTATESKNQTATDGITTIKVTRTQTVHKTAEGTTVSSAKLINATLSVSSTHSESVPVVTRFLTTSVTETALLTATATATAAESIVSESKAIMSSGKVSSSASTSKATSQVETSSAVVISVVLTKTLTQTRMATSTVQEVVSTVTHTPTTVIHSTVTVIQQPLVTSSQEAQCSHDAQDHTVYITVTKPDNSSSKAVKTSKTTSSTVATPKVTDATVIVTYTVTVDSLTPISKVSKASSSSAVSKHSTKEVSSSSKTTRVVTQVATQTVYVTVADGTTIAFSTAVSSALGHVGTPVLTSIPSTESAQASTATDVVVITTTVTDQVFQTVSASSTSPVETDTQTPLSSKSILTTVVLTDRATKTVTVGGGMATVTVGPPKKPTAASSSVVGRNSTMTSTKVIITQVVRTKTVTVNGHIETSLVTVLKNLTSTITLTRVHNATVTRIVTDTARLPRMNTTIHITGTHMMHPRPTLPPYALTNGTAIRPATTYFRPSGSLSVSRPLPTSSAVVTSNAEKRAEPVIFGIDAATGGCKSCTTCLVIFVLGLLVLF